MTRNTQDAALAALRPGRTFGDVVEDLRAPQRAASFPVNASRRRAGADEYPPETDRPTMAADMVLEPGMSFALEPNYAHGEHLAYLGGTVIVTDGDPLELNPYTARLLRAGMSHRQVR